MKVKLHVCCADCLVRYLVATGYPLPKGAKAWVKNYRELPVKSEGQPDYELVFYNPNIYPKTEYQARLAAVREVAGKLKLDLKVLDYRPGEYFALETSQEQFCSDEYLRARCVRCQELRLRKTLEVALASGELGVAVSTTMRASKYLDQEQMDGIGEKLASEMGGEWWMPEFVVDPDELQTSGYYKQNYCGCFFSLSEVTRGKYQNWTAK